MKLSLNLPALERMLGGDSQVEVELREQIAEKFAERHLKCLLNDKVFNQFRKLISSEVDQAISDNIARTRKNGWKRSVSLSAEIKEEIGKAVSEAATDAITARFEEVAEDRLERYERFVENRLKAVHKRMREELDKAFDEKQIEKLVEQRTQQRIELAASFNKNGKEQRSIDLE